MKFEIEIDNCIDIQGYKPVAYRIPDFGDYYIFGATVLECQESNETCRRIILEKIKPEYLVFRKVDLNNSKKVPKGLYKKNNRGWLVMSEDEAIIWDEKNESAWEDITDKNEVVIYRRTKK